MSDSPQHHHVILAPRPDAVDAARELLVRCAERVAAKKAQNGPSSWSASWDENAGHFVVEAVFPSEDAVRFHQENIKDLVANFGSMMAAPPRTVISRPFAAV